jgi:hypothetical protein
MAELQGLGVTHYPGLMLPDDDMSVFLRRTLESGRVPAALRPRVTGRLESHE